MNRQYFNLWYRLDCKDAHLIWFTDEKDGVFVSLEGRVPSFENTEDLLRYAESRGLSVDVEAAILLDLDTLAEWLKQENVESVDCVSVLNAWNLFDDVSRSLGGAFDADRKLTKKIYDKVFWGNNLPSVTPEGESYHPAWTKRELKIMRELLSSGLSFFRSSVS